MYRAGCIIEYLADICAAPAEHTPLDKEVEEWLIELDATVSAHAVHIHMHTQQ